MKSWSKLRRFLKKRYGDPIGEGRTREVYASTFVVFKFPKNENGIIDNLREYNSIFNSSNWIPRAKCKLIFILGCPILMMEKVDINYRETICWDWHSYVDCHQVGLTRHGKEVAYDYAAC